MAARTKPRWGDRAANMRTGEQGTIIDVHASGALGVLPDDGPKTLVVWAAELVDWTPPAPGRTDCPRCRGTHRVVDCPSGLSQGTPS